MTSGCLSWLCCFKEDEGTVDLYNVSTISQVNLVSHVQDTSHFTDNVYDNNVSLFRTVSNDSVPDFGILERNCRSINIIRTQPDHFNPYTPDTKPPVRVTSSYPLCLSDSKTLFKKTVLDATISVPGTFRSLENVRNHSKRRSSISKINDDITTHQASRRPVAVVSNQFLERDGYSLEEESFEEEYESVCCGLWPVRYKASDQDSFHYYESVLPRRLAVSRCDAYTQTEATGRLKTALDRNQDSAYEVVNYRPNGVTFNTVVDINPCVNQTNEVISTDCKYESDSHSKSDNVDQSGDESVRQTGEASNRVYDEAFSAKTACSISKVLQHFKTDNIRTEVHNGQNESMQDTTDRKSDNRCAEDTGHAQIECHCLSASENAARNLYSVVQKPNKDVICSNEHADLSETVDKSNMRYENIDTAKTDDFHQYADEQIYDDTGNVVGDSLGFIPHEKEIELDTINNHKVGGSGDYNNGVNAAQAACAIDCYSTHSLVNALDRCEKDGMAVTEPDEPLYDFVDNYGNTSVKNERHVDKVAENNSNDTECLTDNVYEIQADEAFEESLYDVVGNFTAESYTRYSATDIVLAAQMLETYDTDPEVIYENIHVDPFDDSVTERFESSSESSNEDCGITFSTNIDDHKGNNSDDESLYDMVGDVQRAGADVLMKVSDALKVIAFKRWLMKEKVIGVYIKL